MARNISFNNCLNHMLKCGWKLDSVFETGAKLDFTKNFLPSSLILHTNLQDILSKDQLLILNQITTKSYLNFFYFVEEFIIQQMKILLKRENNEENEYSALEHFFQEEIKHQNLFKRVMLSIDEGMNNNLRVVDFEKKAAQDILKLSPLGVMLFIYHLEIITQVHYVESIRNDNLTCDKITKVLQYHWIEESQHANIDYLEISNMVSELTKSDIIVGMNEYIECFSKLKSVFIIQAGYDVDSLILLTGKSFSKQELELLKNVQVDTYSMLFIKSGLDNRQLNSFFREVLPDYLYIIDKFKNGYNLQNL